MPANFIKVDSSDVLDHLFTDSFQHPVVLFKHSTTCGISAGVFREVASVAGDVHVITIQTHRDLSDSLAMRTGLRHESPQAIVLVRGQAVYHASHYDIEAEGIEASVAGSLA